MVLQKPKYKARATFSYLSQKGDAVGGMVTCCLSLQEDPTISTLLGLAPVYAGHVLQTLKAI